MRLVVDASVALKWYFPEPGSEAAGRWLEAHIAHECDLLAPDLIVAELTNALWKKIRRGECDRSAAEQVLELWEVDCPRLVASSGLAPRALRLADALEEPVYDCLYLAAAVELGAALATSDRRLARAASGVLARVEWVA